MISWDWKGERNMAGIGRSVVVVLLDDAMTQLGNVNLETKCSLNTTCFSYQAGLVSPIR